MQYRKLPVVIEAVRYEGVESIPMLEKFVGKDLKIGSSAFNGKEYTMAVVYIETPEGDMHVSKGDYVVKGVKGEFYPCKPDIFETSHTAVKAPEFAEVNLASLRAAVDAIRNVDVAVEIQTGSMTPLKYVAKSKKEPQFFDSIFGVKVLLHDSIPVDSYKVIYASGKEEIFKW